MSKHTPGPWAFNTFTEHPSLRGGYFIYSPHVHYEIAKLQINGEYNNGLSSDENKANARLIAAAPDLLGLLKSAVVALEDCPFDIHGGDGMRLIEKARLAVNEAEGKEEDDK